MNSKDKAGMTPLHLAAAGDHDEFVAHLIAMKADLNVQNKSGDTPLYLATAHGAIKAAKVLAEAGAVYEQSGGTGGYFNDGEGFAPTTKSIRDATSADPKCVAVAVARCKHLSPPLSPYHSRNPVLTLNPSSTARPPHHNAAR